MSQDSGSKSKQPQRKGGKSPHSLAATPALKLVVSNLAPSKPPRSTEGFSAKTVHKGNEVYQMVAQNPSHYLKCDLTLEVMGNSCEEHGGGVICHFGNIVDEAFNKFVEWDETLYGNLMIQFHMNIMEKLLLFCGEHDASGLIIYVDDAQAEELGIYENILTYQEQTLSELGEKTAMVIPAHSGAFDKWVDFMEETTRRLHQTLWLEQRFNPAIRAYLKSRQTSQQVLH
jgi:hypothetical protein